MNTKQANFEDNFENNKNLLGVESFVAGTKHVGKNLVKGLKGSTKKAVLLATVGGALLSSCNEGDLPVEKQKARWKGTMPDTVFVPLSHKGEVEKYIGTVADKNMSVSDGSSKTVAVDVTGANQSQIKLTNSTAVDTTFAQPYKVEQEPIEALAVPDFLTEISFSESTKEQSTKGESLLVVQGIKGLRAKDGVEMTGNKDGSFVLNQTADGFTLSVGKDFDYERCAEEFFVEFAVFW